MIGMAFRGWPIEAVEFYEGLEADNSKVYWQEHKAVYERQVKAPMEELLADCAEDGIPAGSINAIDGVFAEPQVQARGMRISPEGVPGVRSPFKFSDAELCLDRASPKLGDG